MRDKFYNYICIYILIYIDLCVDSFVNFWSKYFISISVKNITVCKTTVCKKTLFKNIDYQQRNLILYNRSLVNKYLA